MSNRLYILTGILEKDEWISIAFAFVFMCVCVCVCVYVPLFSAPSYNVSTVGTTVLGCVCALHVCVCVCAVCFH